ncbi:MAG TPA: DUF2065 domain-containing protein [Steroidobacteraceae bacterium]|nr:DUF2065 domain-containing protein [Steroidobacteraceae bacterium]
MTIKYSDLLAALALVLIIEGIAPFLSPGAVKRALTRIVQFGDRELRIMGLTCMACGVALLFIVT